jgi:hypothetical protein
MMPDGTTSAAESTSAQSPPRHRHPFFRVELDERVDDLRVHDEQ